MNITPLIDADPVIKVHVIAALTGLILGGVILFQRKGTIAHKLAGRVWVLMTALTALSSFLIWEIRVIGLFSPIHLLSVITLISLVGGLQAARAGNISLHKRTFKSLYFGAFAVTGAFTLMPGRLMNDILIEPALGVDFVPEGSTNGLDRIVAQTPIWVWPLLIGLLAVGLLSTRNREKSLPQMLPLPITFAGLATAGLIASNNMMLTATAMAMAATITCWFGYKVTARKQLTMVDERRLLVPGEWSTMVIIITVFVAKFVFGAASGMNPAVADMPMAIIAMGLISGAALGFSTGRVSAYIWRLKRKPINNSVANAS